MSVKLTLFRLAVIGQSIEMSTSKTLNVQLTTLAYAKNPNVQAGLKKILLEFESPAFDL